MLSQQFIADIRTRLLDERDALQNDIANSDDSTRVVELDQSKVGRLSRMDALQAQAMAQANAQRRANRLRAIGAALRRIDEQDYGYCANCGEAINEKRIGFDPTVTLCIDCATRSER